MKEFLPTETLDLVRPFFEKQGIVPDKVLEGGHKGAMLLRARMNEEDVVIKIGTDPTSVKEVEDNLYAYSGISEIGGGGFLPNPIVALETPVGPGIMMPYLGVDFRKLSADSSVTGSNFMVLRLTLDGIYPATLSTNRGAHEQSVGDVVRKISYRFGQLEAAGLVGGDYEVAVGKLDVQQIAGNRSVLSLLDLTPDNIFIHEDSAKFIDPWKQESYLGTPLPGLSQFMTLACDIYQIPGFTDVELGYNRYMEQIGIGLDLSPSQMKTQIELGRALQYSLSAKVRIYTNPQLAKEYASRAVDALTKATGDDN